MTSLHDEEIQTGRADTLGQGGETAADADLDDADTDGTDDSDSNDSDSNDSDSGDSSDDADAVDPSTGPADSAG